MGQNGFQRLTTGIQFELVYILDNLDDMDSITGKRVVTVVE